MNVFIFHRDLRLYDNTTLIEMLKEYKEVVSIFIFSDKQIDKKKNPYYSNFFVQFMCQSLDELNDDIKDKGGKLHYFKGDNLDILKKIHKISPLNALGFNMDYSPFAKERDSAYKDFCKDNNIKLHCSEDYVLDNIMDKKNLTGSGTPYQKFTPYYNNRLKNNKVRPVDKFNNFKFKKTPALSKIEFKGIHSTYERNDGAEFKGGRKLGLDKVKNLANFKDYKKNRDYVNLPTTHLSSYINLGCVSIREVYHRIESLFSKNHDLIRQLYWRDFYTNILYYFPFVTQQSLKKKYDKIQWINNQEQIKAMEDGTTGFPIVDAAIRRLNKTGFLENRLRLIIASFAIKDCLIDWRIFNKIIMSRAIDANIANMLGGLGFIQGGYTDSQAYDRIFNPYLQQQKYDKECKYIKKWVLDLKDIPCKDIHKWDINYVNYPNVYIEPILNHKEASKKTKLVYKKIFS